MSKEELRQIEKRITSELEPFIDGIMNKRANYELFKQAYTDSQQRLIHAAKIAQLLARADTETTRVTLKDVLYRLFAYVGFVESLGNTLVDIVIMLLVANGRDFHIESRHATPRIKHVAVIKDLEDERVPLSTKLNFLRKNGIKELASLIDSELRNIIAHLRFEVEEDNVYIRGKPAFDVFANSTFNLLVAVVYTFSLLWELDRAKGLTKKKKE